MLLKLIARCPWLTALVLKLWPQRSQRRFLDWLHAKVALGDTERSHTLTRLSDPRH